jgi:hypothetical protein
MNRNGHASPRPAARAAGLPQPPASAGGTQLQMRGPGESWHFDKAHWVASKITGQALQQARHIAAELAATRGWNTRIITETGRALAVVLADHTPGGMIAWSELSPALLRHVNGYDTRLPDPRLTHPVRLFPHRSPRQSSANAAVGGLGPSSAARPRGAKPSSLTQHRLKKLYLHQAPLDVRDTCGFRLSLAGTRLYRGFPFRC